MTDNNLLDSPETDKSLSTEKDKGTQSVINIFGYELTAPAGLKNPGVVYLSFIFVNLLIFLILRSFISG